MNQPNKIICYASTFTEFSFPVDDIEFMLPGIIHKYFEQNENYFEHFITSNLNYGADGKEAALLKMAYYEMMADTVGVYLDKKDENGVIARVIKTHYVDDAQIFKAFRDGKLISINSVLIKFLPKYGHSDKY